MYLCLAWGNCTGLGCLYINNLKFYVVLSMFPNTFFKYTPDLDHIT